MYIVTHKLGFGRFSGVFKAQEEGTKEFAALKIFESDKIGSKRDMS